MQPSSDAKRRKDRFVIFTFQNVLASAGNTSIWKIVCSWLVDIEAADVQRKKAETLLGQDNYEMKIEMKIKMIENRKE